MKRGAWSLERGVRILLPAFHAGSMLHAANSLLYSVEMTALLSMIYAHRSPSPTLPAEGAEPGCVEFKRDEGPRWSGASPRFIFFPAKLTGVIDYDSTRN